MTIFVSHRIHQYPTILSAFAYAIYLSTYASVLGTVYWRAVVLLEQGELTTNNMIM